MKRKLSAADIFDTLEVDLWGHLYTLRAITRSIVGKFEEAQKKAAELDADEKTSDSEALAAALIGIVDIVLEPVGPIASAGELLTEQWEKDALGIDWLTAFVDTLTEEAQARRRPTSPRPSSA